MRNVYRVEYRVVCNTATDTWSAASELTSGRKKAAATSALIAVTIAVIASAPFAANVAAQAIDGQTITATTGSVLTPGYNSTVRVINGSVLNASGLGGSGVNMNSQGAALIMSDSTVNASGFLTFGINQIGGTVNLQNVSLNNNTVAPGIVFGSPGIARPSLSIANSRIHTVATGVSAIAAGTMSISNNSAIETSGAGGIGIDLHRGATLSAIDTGIQTSGPSAAGVRLGSGDASTVRAAAAELSNVRIHTLGASSVGVFVANSGSIDAHGSVVVSDQSHGVQFGDGANNSVSLDTGSVVDAGQAIVFSDQVGSHSRFNANDSTLTSRSGSGFIAGNGAQLAVTLTNSAVDVGIGGLIARAENGGQLTLTGAGTTLRGGMQVADPASTLSLSLNAAQWMADGHSSVTDLTIDSGSVANVSQGQAVSGVLTVKGNLSGHGRIVLNTVLGGDDSATDKVVIDGGHAAGQTTLAVNNVGGTGLHTINGIMVVEAINSGTTDTGAFRLDAPVRAGAFDYRLFRGGQNAAQSDNWYLRDTYNPEPVEPEPEGNSGVTPPVQENILGPELSVYGSIAPTAMGLGQATLGTLDDRLGRSDAIATDAQSQNNRFSGSWGRVFGQSYRDHYSSLVDPSVSTKIGGFQAGVDILNRQQLQGGRDRVGAYLGFAHADANVDGTVTLTNADGNGQNVRQNTGNLKLDGWSAGAYWTHFGQSGWYTDVVLQGTVYNGTASTDRTSVGVKGTGITATVDGGYPFAVTKNLMLEPQAQVIYQNVNLKNTVDRLGSVDLGSSNSVLGRAGAKLQYTHQDGKQVIQPYLKANLWSTLGGTNSAVSYGGIDAISTKAGGSWGEAGAGVTAKVSQKISINAHVSGLFRMSGQARSGIDVGAAVKVDW